MRCPDSRRHGGAVALAGLAALFVAPICTRADTINFGGASYETTFADDFGGATVDAAKWTSYTANSGTIVENNGNVTLNTQSANNKCAYLYLANNLDFTASPDEWIAQVTFQVNTGYFATTNSGTYARQYSILTGMNNGTDMNVYGIDLRAVQDGSGTSGSTYGLAWYGFDNLAGGSSRVATALSTLNKGAWYTVTLHRKGDGNVDIYQDGSLIATRSLINGVNPTILGLGDLTSMTCRGVVSFDSVAVAHSVPEPTTMGLLFIGALSYIAYASRGRK